MPLKGHNWGICRVCAKKHGVHPKPNKGKHFSKQHKANLRNAILNAIKEGKLPRVQTEEEKQRRTESLQQLWQNPDFREKQAKGMRKLERQVLAPWKGKKFSMEHRRHISEGLMKTIQPLRLKHKQLIFETAQDLEKQGFRSIIIDVRSEVPQPDIIAIKDGKVYAVEIEIGRTKPRFHKYSKYNPYDDVWWVQRK